jgi:2-keto-3-deoxygluconate permease
MDVRSKIKQLFKAIPGGIMIVPLLFAMMINTLFPAFFEIGNVTTALFQEGVLTLLGLLFFLVGTQFQLGECIKTWPSGLALVVYKLTIGSGLALLVYHFYGLEGVAGVTPLILLIALTQPNLAMFVAITLKLGRPSQLNILPLVVLLEMPLLTMFVLDINGMIQTSLTDYLPFLCHLL